MLSPAPVVIAASALGERKPVFDGGIRVMVGVGVGGVPVTVGVGVGTLKSGPM